MYLNTFWPFVKSQDLSNVTIQVLDHEHKYRRYFAKGQHEVHELYFLKKFPKSRVCLSLFLFSLELPHPALVLLVSRIVQKSHEDLPSESLWGAALLLFLQLTLDFPQRRIHPNLESRDRLKQILEANLHNVTCFLRRQVVLMIEVNGAQDSVACAWNRLTFPSTRHTWHLHPVPHRGFPHPCISHWCWQTLRSHLKELPQQFVSVCHPLLSLWCTMWVTVPM